MKKIFLFMFFCLVINTGLVFSIDLTKIPYMNTPAKIIQVGTAKDREKLPIIVFLPATDYSATNYYNRYKSYQPFAKYIAVIPDGTPTRSQYGSNFWKYIQTYEKRLLKDIKIAKKNKNADPNKIYIQGFSLGGDLGWSFINRHKELFAGALIRGSRTSYPLKNNVMRYYQKTQKKVIFAMGRDEIDRKKGMKFQYNKMKKGGANVFYQEVPGGHGLPDFQNYKYLIKAMVGIKGELPKYQESKNDAKIISDKINETIQKKKVFEWIKKNNMTVANNIKEFNYDNLITREEFSKFAVILSINKNRQRNSNTNCGFTDIYKSDKNLIPYIITACNMSIMKGNKSKFNPKNKLTKAEVLTVIVRLLGKESKETTDPRYKSYFNTAKSLNITFDTVNNIHKNVSRGDVATMMYRAYH